MSGVEYLQCPACGWSTKKVVANHNELTRQLCGHLAHCPRKLLNDRIQNNKRVSTRGDLKRSRIDTKGLGGNDYFEEHSQEGPGEHPQDQGKDESVIMKEFDEYEEEWQEDDFRTVDYDVADEKNDLCEEEKILSEDEKVAAAKKFRSIVEIQERFNKQLSEKQFQVRQTTTQRDHIELALLGENLLISDSEGDMILATFNLILERHGVKRFPSNTAADQSAPTDYRVGEEFKFPVQWKTIRSGVKKQSEEYCKISKWRFDYDADYFGKLDKHKQPLLGPTGVGFDIRERLAEIFLNCSPKQFHGVPLKRLNDKDETLISSFPSANFMQRAYDALILRMGDKICDDLGRPYVLVCVAVSKDKAAMNSTRSVSATPVIMKVVNLLNKASEQVTFLGLTPQDDQYSKEMMHEHLEKVMRCCIKKRRENAIRYSNREIMFKYYEVLLGPLLAYEKSGFLLNVGRVGDPDYYQAVAFPYYTFLFGDNEDLDDLLSVSSGCKNSKCRYCMASNCVRISAEHADCRNHTQMNKLTKELGQLDKRLYKDSLGQKKSCRMTAEEINLCLEGKRLSVIPGANFNYKLGQYAVEEGLHKGLHTMAPADKLHTFDKGLCLYGCSWSMQCAYALQDINKAEYGTLVASIDSIFVNFPRWQAINPFRIFDMPLGISTYFTEARSNTYKGTGMQTLGLAAYRMSGITYMLLAAVGDGTADSLIPSRLKYPTPNSLKTKDAWNVSKVITNALQSLLDIASFSDRPDGFTVENFKHLSKLIRINQAHMLMLFEMRNQLMNCARRIDPKQALTKIFGGHKMHVFGHYVSDMMEWGSDDSIFNTQLTERLHIKVKALYERSSKRKLVCHEEMGKRMAFQFYLLQLVERYEIDDLKRHVHAYGPTPSNKQMLIKDTMAYTFNFVSNFPKDKIGLMRFPNGKGGICVIKDRPKPYVTPYLHPYLSMESFTEVLFSDSLDSDCRTILNTIVEDTASNRTTFRNSMELLSGISCEGIESFNVPPFHIYCNGAVPKNRNAQKENKVFVQNFSCLEVEFSDGEVALVRVLGIVKLSPAQNRPYGSHTEQLSCSGHNEVRLLVLKFVSDDDDGKDKKRVRYAWTAAQEGRREGPEIHLIELKAIIRPACVIPQFTKSSSGIEKEAFDENSKRTYKKKRFDHIPVHSISNFDVCNTFASGDYAQGGTRDEGKIDLSDIPTNLSDNQIEQIQNIILERSKTVDGFREDDDDDRDQIYDDFEMDEE